jgi:hypothetical protein
MPNFESLHEFFECYFTEWHVCETGYGNENIFVAAVYHLDSHRMTVYALNTNFPLLEDAQDAWKRLFNENIDKLDEFYEFVLESHKVIEKTIFE